MNYKTFFTGAALLFLLTACAGEATPAPASAEDIIAGINTAAALTMMPLQPQVENQNVNLPAVTTVPATPMPVATATLIQPVFSPTSVTYFSVSACDNAAYLSDVTISDGTILAPGEVFTKTWSFQNTGTCAWASDYAITYSSGESMSGATTAIEKTVVAGEAANISVELTAPETEGNYTGYWILANSSGITFGNIVYAQIIVTETAATSTPTPTATTEVTATIEPTATPVPTSTPEPTSVPTIAPTAEATAAEPEP